MIRVRALRGLAVVDVGAAQSVGHIEEVFLSPDYHRVAGFLVSSGQSLINKSAPIFLPAACVRAVGPDALTISHSGISSDSSSDGSGAPGSATDFPRMSHLVGQKVVTESGRLLGTIEDALIDAEDGRVVRYELAATTSGSKLENLLGINHARPHDYIRADTDLRVGPDLIVVPDDALIIEDDLETDTSPPISSDITGDGDTLEAFPPASEVTPPVTPLTSTPKPTPPMPVAPTIATSRWANTSPSVVHPTPPIIPSASSGMNALPVPPPGLPTSPVSTGNEHTWPAVPITDSANVTPAVSQPPGVASGAVQHGIDNDPHNDAEKGATLGGVGGLAVGAAAGSMAGPIGTIVGAIVGGLAGALGSGAAVAAVDEVDNDNTLTGVSQWEQVAPHYRQGWEQHYGHTGAQWEQHEPIYRFAWERRHAPQYHQRSWAEAQSDLQHEWEAHSPSRPWAQVQNSVRAGWDVSGEVLRQHQTFPSTRR